MIKARWELGSSSEPGISPFFPLVAEGGKGSSRFAFLYRFLFLCFPLVSSNSLSGLKTDHDRELFLSKLCL